MKVFSLFWCITTLIALLLCMAVSGLRNECVPDKKISELSFYLFSYDTKDSLIERMASFKEDHRNLVQKNLHEDMMWQFLPPEGYPEMMEEEKEEGINKQKLFISKNKMRWLSNNLMSPSVWDEQNILRALYRFRPERLDFNPHYFRYGGAWLYPMSLSLYAASKSGIFRLVKDTGYYMQNPQQILMMSMAAKSYGIICYIITIFVALYLITREFYNRRVFLIAAFFTVFCPLLVVETVYLKPFLTCMMWYVFTIYFLFRILDERGKKAVNAVLAGLSAGLAAGSLIPAVTLLAPVFIALTYNRLFPLRERKFFRPPYTDLKLVIYSFGVFLAVFLIANPYVLLSWGEFIKEMSFNVGYHSDYRFWDARIHLQNIEVILKGVSPFFGLFCLASLVWAMFNNREKKLRIILFAFFSYYLFVFVECLIEDSAHALVPVLPLLILLAAQFMISLSDKHIIIRRTAYCLIGCVAFYSVLNSFFYASLLKDRPRITAGEWINKNIPFGTSIGTFIDNSGLSYAYPYFNYFNYRFINDSSFELVRIKENLPQYYIVAQRYSQDRFTLPEEKIPSQYEKYINKDRRGSGFRWLVRIDEERIIAPYYEKIAEFRSPSKENAAIFKNNLVKWWTKEISIYRKKPDADIEG